MFSISWKGDGHSVLGLWRRDSPWCNAERNDIRLKRLYQHAEKMRNHFQHVWPDKSVCKMLLQQNNTTPQTSVKTQEATTQLGWLVLPHPSYSPGLAPLQTPKRCCPWKEVWVRWWCHKHHQNLVLCQQDKEWYRSGIHALVPQWHTAMELHREYVENQDL